MLCFIILFPIPSGGREGGLGRGGGVGVGRRGGRVGGWGGGGRGWLGGAWGCRRGRGGGGDGIFFQTNLKKHPIFQNGSEIG